MTRPLNTGGQAMLTTWSPRLAARLRAFVGEIAAQPDVRAAVEANHDDNRWWPAYVRDWRMRMLVAGWSSRVSYAMISAYARVVGHANALGWDMLQSMGDDALTPVVRPIGLPTARIRYLRSLSHFIKRSHDLDNAMAVATPDELIQSIAESVDGAGYNTAQCAVLYARGYHCGVIPVDSGMVTKLAPMLGITLSAGQVAHEQLRHLLEQCVRADQAAYRAMASRLHYRITIPPAAHPTWLVHLALIYFKRLYLNPPRPGLCRHLPACSTIFACGAQASWTRR